MPVAKIHPGAETLSETRPRRIGRSLGALAAGFAIVVILTLATDIALHAAGALPPLGQPTSNPLVLLLATVYRTVYGITGSYITARLVAERATQHGPRR